MPHIFLSYSRTDRDKAALIAQLLEKSGFSVWWDNSLRAGQTYDEVTERHLREAAAIVVLWSKESVKSKWVRAEATLGERTSSIVPAMIEEADRPIMFELVQTADLVGWNGDEADARWQQFTGDVRQAIERRESDPVKKMEAEKPKTQDDTIETAFWNSIRNTKSAADLQAYIKRYPEGHFVDLAKNRLLAIQAARSKAKAAASQKPAAEPVAKSAPPPPRPTATPDKQASSSSALPLLAGGGAAVLALAAAGYFFLGGGGEKEPSSAQTTNPATEIVAEKFDSAPGDVHEGDTVVEVMQQAVTEDNIQLAENDATGIEGAAPEADAAGQEASRAGSATGEDPMITEIATGTEAESSTPPPDHFSDCDLCPVMKPVPAGSFMIGSPTGEAGRVGNEGPQKEITLGAYAIAETEVTFDQWAACVEDGGCGRYMPSDRGFGAGEHPVQSVSWRDATAYVTWLGEKTGRSYRLPSEAEWEYAARAGTQSRFWWGDGTDSDKMPRGATRAVSSLPENPFGLRGVAGNVREWTADCYVNNFSTLPEDGTARKSGDCSVRVIRGGGWRTGTNEHRHANRALISRSTRDSNVGFRVATSELPPEFSR